MLPEHQDIIERITGCSTSRMQRLHGGCVGDVQRVDLADGSSLVVKAANAGMDTEGWMLTELASRTATTGKPLPVPKVLHAQPTLLVMEHISHDGQTNAHSELDAAAHLARLHSITSDAFGLERSTPIGGLAQDNTPSTSWADFYAQRRLFPMARTAYERGNLSTAQRDTIGELAERLIRVLDASGYDPEHPGAKPRLIHGDVWAGNILWHQGSIAAFIDPAMVYADAECELAFIDLFGTLGRGFYEEYHTSHPPRAGYASVRRVLYQVYPLLVHAALFGGGLAGGYGDQACRAAESCLSKTAN